MNRALDPVYTILDSYCRAAIFLSGRQVCPRDFRGPRAKRKMRAPTNEASREFSLSRNTYGRLLLVCSMGPPQALKHLVLRGPLDLEALGRIFPLPPRLGGLVDRGTIYIMPKLSSRRSSANEREIHFAL